MPAGINYTVFGNVFKGQDVLFNISHARPARGSQGQTLAVPAEAIHINRVVIVDGPMQANPAPNIAPKDAVPETELSLAPQQEAFTYGEPIILRLMLKNPYDSSLQLPSMGLAKNLKITRLEENPGGELRRTEEKTNPDFSEMFLPVSRGLLGPGAQVGVRLDITDACPAFADGGTFEISWEAGGIKTKPLTLRIQKSLFANIATTRGVFQAILYPEAAPLAVGRFKQLAEDGFYNGLPFYAVVKTPALSLAQAGSKSGDSTGKATNLPDIPLEQSDRPFDIGTIGFSHTRTNADSGSSQFFIITQIGADGSASLFRRYTVIGKIISARDEKGDPADYRALLSKLTAEDKVLKIEISAKKTK
jgi:cyclophilin family peptidyl-prolyl cis-trans isomerase